MKASIAILVLAAVLGISYASLWYGFSKGYEYRTSDNLTESIMIVHALKSLRSNKTDDAAYQLENILDKNIIERSVGDTDFIKYVVGLPQNSPETVAILKARIINYRKSSGYVCDSIEEACEIVNRYVYEK
ncbi:MAG: hypothetical protein ABW138_09235 [Candidatus Thiodiazotropha sp. 4PDIVS1]